MEVRDRGRTSTASKLEKLTKVKHNRKWRGWRGDGVDEEAALSRLSSASLPAMRLLAQPSRAGALGLPAPSTERLPAATQPTRGGERTESGGWRAPTPRARRAEAAGSRRAAGGQGGDAGGAGRGRLRGAPSSRDATARPGHSGEAAAPWLTRSLRELRQSFPGSVSSERTAAGGGGCVRAAALGLPALASQRHRRSLPAAENRRP